MALERFIAFGESMNPSLTAGLFNEMRGDKSSSVKADPVSWTSLTNEISWNACIYGPVAKRTLSMKRGHLATILVVISLFAVVVLLYFTAELDNQRSTDAVKNVTPWALLKSEESFQRPRFPREFSFPVDHGPHPRFRTEWWSMAGSLEDRQGNRLGLQLTIMRLGLMAKPPDRASRWAATDVYAGIFSVSDPTRRRLQTDSRTVRGAAIELAGAVAEPRRVWVGDWQLKQTDTTGPGLSLTLHSQTAGVMLALVLHNEKSLVDENAIRRSLGRQDPPFHFYIEPRIRANGRLRIDDAELTIHGIMTMEHAWGELPLPGGAVAVDRFTLHLDDGREILLNRTHRVDGGGSPDITGLFVDAEGRSTLLNSADVNLSPIEYWKHDRTGAHYPIRWLLQIPGHALELALSPYYEDQAGDVWLPFWAGPMRISTPSPESTMVGNGLVQLTGYERNE